MVAFSFFFSPYEMKKKKSDNGTKKNYSPFFSI